MVQRRLIEAAAAMGGTLTAGALECFEGAALDSRRVRPGQLFFALPGERTDGHRFVADAGRRGAGACVVSRPVDIATDTALIRVEDTYRALHSLTRWVRKEVPERLVAITGSAGKTTTKELLALLLGRRFRVGKSEGNLNNLYGFPLSLLNLADDAEWMVAEMGMSEAGELGRISRLGQPDAAVFTNVRPAHLERFGSLRAIADAKAELLEGLRPGALVVANAGDPLVVGIGRRWLADGGPTEWFAGEDARLAGTGIEVRFRTAGTVPNPTGGYRFRFLDGDLEVPIALPLHGRYNVDNFLAAAAAARCLGIPMETIAAAARDARSGPGRGSVRRLPGAVTVIDDSYNSNPEAAVRALESSAELPSRRRWAVLGDMLELGEDEERFHAEVGRAAAKLGFSPVVGVGERSRALVAAAGEEGAEARWLADAATAAAALGDELAAGDLVLVKASRGVGLEVVVDCLATAAEGMGDA